MLLVAPGLTTRNKRTLRTELLGIAPNGAIGRSYREATWSEPRQVPFAPGRKDKASGAECPAWDGPTCKEG